MKIGRRGFLCGALAADKAVPDGRDARRPSGAAQGADKEALEAAVWQGLEFGGWAPHGWLAEKPLGSIPEAYRAEMREYPDQGSNAQNYRERTKANVRDGLLHPQGRLRPQGHRRDFLQVAQGGLSFECRRPVFRCRWGDLLVLRTDCEGFARQRDGGFAGERFDHAIRAELPDCA